MANHLTKPEFFLGLEVAIGLPTPKSCRIFDSSNSSHEKCITPLPGLCHCLKLQPPPSFSPSSQEKMFLPAGEIFIAIQKTCSSIKCVPGVVYSRTLQKQTVSEQMHDIVRTCSRSSILFYFLML